MDKPHGLMFSWVLLQYRSQPRTSTGHRLEAWKNWERQPDRDGCGRYEVVARLARTAIFADAHYASRASSQITPAAVQAATMARDVAVIRR